MIFNVSLMLFNISNQPKQFKYRAEKIRALTVCYSAATSSDRYLYSSNFLPLVKLIKLQKGILAYKMNNGQYLLSNFPIHRHYQLRNNADLRIPLHATHMPSNLSTTEKFKPAITCHKIYESFIPYHSLIVLGKV